MKKLVKAVWCAVLLLSFFSIGSLIADKQVLRNDLIRLHVVANSDTDQDQQVKFQVRDAVVAYLYDGMRHIKDSQQAKEFLQKNRANIEQLANKALQSAGSSHRAKVTLKQEEFSLREYETFSLPSGVYESIRIEIGSGTGENWWCVAFPSLCLPATSSGFRDTAVSSGIEDGLVNTLSREDGYEVRFYLLDCLGKLENLLFFKR